MRLKSKDIFLSFLLLQLLLFIVSFGWLSFILYGTPISEGYSKLILLFITVWVGIVIAGAHEELYVLHSLKRRIYYRIKNLFILVGITSPVILLFQDSYSRTMIFGTPFLFLALDFWLFTFIYYYHVAMAGTRNFSGERRRVSNLLILGAEETSKRVVDFASKNKHLGYEVVGILDDKQTMHNGLNILGRIGDLSKVLETQRVDEIIIATKEVDNASLRKAVEAADHNGIRVNFIPDFIHELNGAGWALRSTELPVIDMREIPLDRFHNYFMKRIFDILFSGTVLLLISPILTAVAILIKLDSKGPIFYKPIRKGQHGKQFSCFKFRSMYADLGDDPKNGKKSTVKGDTRITRIGTYLRKYNIDELPQLINVLIGDMSIVGPRPHRVFLDLELQSKVKKYMLRYYIKPGITGWAQVNGWRGPTETEEQKYQRVHHDLWYIEHWNFWMDIKIIFRTVFDRKVVAVAF